jgi:hypothetical protein
MGEGGDAVLNAAAGNFEAFNREQQGQIMMHWFVRSQLEIRDAANTLVTSDSTAWNPAHFFDLFRYVAQLCASKDQKNALHFPLVSLRTP